MKSILKTTLGAAAMLALLASPALAQQQGPDQDHGMAHGQDAPPSSGMPRPMQHPEPMHQTKTRTHEEVSHPPQMQHPEPMHQTQARTHEQVSPAPMQHPEPMHQTSNRDQGN